MRTELKKNDGQAQLVYVLDISSNIPTTRRLVHGDRMDDDVVILQEVMMLVSGWMVVGWYR